MFLSAIMAMSLSAQCGFDYTAIPSKYLDPSLPPVSVELVPFKNLLDICVLMGYKLPKPRPGVRVTLLGCAPVGEHRIVIPTEATWPGSKACYAENRRHETAHANGWPADHPKE